MEREIKSIDREEVLRYLGYRGGPLDLQVERQLQEAEAAICRAARPRTVYRAFSLHWGEHLGLEETTFFLQGRDIREHLAGCHTCILMAATLGGDLEREIRRAQVRDMALAAVMDAAADAAIEQVCDGLWRRLMCEYMERDAYLTDRYSPGYGDFPLSQQAEFCAVLDTERKIGLTVTENQLLTPRKSVTALLGAAETQRRRREADCGACPVQANCMFRKAGKTCAK